VGAGFDHASWVNVHVAASDLSRAMFDHATLQGCDLSGVQAPGISLRDARLHRTSLRDACLTSLDARGVALDHVDLTNADCEGGNLIGQPPEAWRVTQHKHARFVDDRAIDDQAWWNKNKPGPRRVWV
jgi:uncharacterized protein YjbI with pentapeptide repeats